LVFHSRTSGHGLLRSSVDASAWAARCPHHDLFVTESGPFVEASW